MTARELALESIEEGSPKLKDAVTVVCVGCQNKFVKKFGYVVKCCRNSNKRYRCLRCSNREISSRETTRAKIRKTKEQNRDKISAVFKALWRTDTFRQKVTASCKKQANSKDGIEQRRQQALAAWNDNDFRDNISKKARENYDFEFTDDVRRKLSEATRKQWQDPEYRAKTLKVLARATANSPKVSSIQLLLYSLLDKLNVRYYREYNDKPDDENCKIGPYSFDCVIVPNSGPDILVECQGDYWHNLPQHKARDAKKKAYIQNNFDNVYKLKYIWEHEFKDNLDGVKATVKSWLG